MVSVSNNVLCFHHSEYKLLQICFTLTTLHRKSHMPWVRIRKMKFREAKGCTQSHPAGRYQCQIPLN